MPIIKINPAAKTIIDFAVKYLLIKPALNAPSGASATDIPIIDDKGTLILSEGTTICTIV
ncbi:MAG: hypothetical protein Q4D65_00685 [Peptostreptococcaceae bacterium]|nr:hypothetical protein [Peptostreptococcaceae bacterium]